MNKRTKSILIKIIILAVLTIASFVMYFYVQLSGNPIEGWQEKKALLSIYEERYGEDFTVTDTIYSYKLNEFSFVLHPASDPELEFRTTLYEASVKDAYGTLKDYYFSNVELR